MNILVHVVAFATYSIVHLNIKVGCQVAMDFCSQYVRFWFDMYEHC